MFARTWGSVPGVNAASLLSVIEVRVGFRYLIVDVERMRAGPRGDKPIFMGACLNFVQLASLSEPLKP